ncbi:MAG: class E sortase [Actinomycetota bacterium]|nr:class E sortase [Actinomycetota bacterium]
MRDPRRLVAVLILGLLVSLGGATALHNAEAGNTDADDPRLQVAAAATTTTSTTVAPATTAVPPATVAPATRPVQVPKDPYANEPLKEIGRIEIPKIGLTHRLFEGITLRTIDNGPSHWPGTAMPGQRGNAVFAGHRVTHSKPFRNIDQLAPGDEVIFTVGDTRSVYKVTGSKVVTPKALEIVNPTPTATATLFACHPPGSAKFRYVVLLALAEDAQSAAPAAPSQSPAS